MAPKRSLSVASDGYPARPTRSALASPFNGIDDATLTAEDILARPRRAAQFKPGRYTIFAPPSDSDDGYEFYGDSEFEKDDVSEFDPNERPAKSLHSHPEPERAVDTTLKSATRRDENENANNNTATRATNLRDPPCHKCSWVSSVMINKPVRLCEPYSDKACLHCSNRPGKCIPPSAQAIPLVERMYYAYEFSGVDSPEFTEARSIAATQLRDDFLARRGKVPQNGGRTTQRGRARRGRRGALSSNGRGVGRGGSAKSRRARPVARSAELHEADSEVITPVSRSALVDYDSDEPAAMAPDQTLSLVPYNSVRQAGHTQNDPPVQTRDVQVPEVRPPRLQTLEPLPEPMKGIVRKVMEIMDEQYGAPDSVTRDRMLAMGIRVAIEMALHFDPTLAYVLSMASSGRD